MENNNPNTLNDFVLTEKVRKLKLVARDALRMELINPRLADINQLEKESTALNQEKAAEEKRIAIAEYKIKRLARLDADHPDYAALVDSQKETITHAQKTIERIAQSIENIDKLIENKKNDITKIETGEWKVNADRLEEMVNILILQDAKDTVANQSN